MKKEGQKIVLYGQDARQKLLIGIEKLYNAVKVTLGPRGRNVLISQEFMPPKLTKDGVTVARAVELDDPIENMGAQLVKEIAKKTNEEAGDGTTTATILTYEIYKEACRSVASGINPMELKKGIDKSIKHIVNILGTYSKPLESSKEIAQIATISANGDKKIGELVSSAMEKVGKNGVISIQEGKLLETTLEIVEGMKIDRGFISPYFINNPKEQSVEMNDPLIFIYDGKVSTFQQIQHVLEMAVMENKPLLFIVEDLEGEALASLVFNKLKGVINVCAIKAPGFGNSKTDLLQDISISTGSTLVSPEIGMKIEQLRTGDLGSAQKVIIKKDTCLFVKGKGNPELVRSRINMLQMQVAEAETMYDQERYNERIAKLGNGIAIIKVGGSSDVEVNEYKDRIEDALNSTKAAVSEGILPGGGISLIYSSKDLISKISLKNFDQNVGVKLVERALKAPTRILVSNSGQSGDTIIEKIIESQNVHYGFNAFKGKFEDLLANGVIDPFKVVKTALINSSSVSGLLSTTEALICKEKNQNNSTENDYLGPQY